MYVAPPKAVIAAAIFALVNPSHGLAGNSTSPDDQALVLLKQAAANFEQIKTIRATVHEVITIRGVGQRFQGEYVSTFPGRFNMRFYYPYEQRIVSDGKALWWYIPKSKKVWQVDDYPSFLAESATNLPGTETTSQLGFEKIREVLAANLNYRIVNTWREWLTRQVRIEFQSQASSPALRGVVWLARSHGMPIRLDLTAPDGSILLRQTMRDYQRLGTLLLPTKVAIEMPATKASIEIAYADVTINGPFNEAEFHFSYPKGVPVVPLTNAM